jgi:hypothetical protein
MGLPRRGSGHGVGGCSAIVRQREWSIAASKYRRSSFAYQGPRAGFAMTSRTSVTEGRSLPSIR